MRSRDRFASNSSASRERVAAGIGQSVWLLWLVVAVIVLTLAYQLRTEGVNGWTLALAVVLVLILLRDVLIKVTLPGLTAEFEHPTLNIGGSELSLQEVTDQIREQLSDLQQALAKPDQTRSNSSQELEVRVLWVSWMPSQSAVLVASLVEDKVAVTQASSVAKAVEILHKDFSFDAVVYDFGLGTEHETLQVRKGLDDLVRGMPNRIPVVLYTSKRVLLQLGRFAAEDEILVTASAIELRRYLVDKRQGGAGVM